jgi:O-antigen/teichoic acid export membrane protein
MLSQAASTVLLPRLSTMHDDPISRLALTQKSYLVVLSITAMAGGVATFALYWLLGPVFGEEYQEAFPVFLWLLPGIIVGAGSRVQANCIAAAGKPEWNMYVSMGLVTMNVAGNIMLIPTYGIQGAAGVTSGVYVVNAAIKQFLVRRTVRHHSSPSMRAKG